MGGYLSLLAAARRPDLARGVVLLDSPLIAGWRARVLQLAKATGVGESLSPGHISKRRKYQWPSADAAFQHFASKAAFARWAPRRAARLHRRRDRGRHQRPAPELSARDRNQHLQHPASPPGPGAAPASAAVPRGVHRWPAVARTSACGPAPHAPPRARPRGHAGGHTSVPPGEAKPKPRPRWRASLRASTNRPWWRQQRPSGPDSTPIIALYHHSICQSRCCTQ